MAQTHLYELNYIAPNSYFKTPTLFGMVFEDEALERQLELVEGMPL